MRQRIFSLFLPILTLVFIFSCSRPIAKFSYQGEGQAAPAKLVFDNKSENAEAYQWDFGDGTTSSEENPSHEYKSSGNYVVQLKALKGTKEKVVEQRIQITAPLVCLVELETEYGSMLIELFDATPKHRDNFTKLAEEGFYNDLLFHRVIEGFMIQGGDPDSKNANPGQALGSGGPGYQVPAEFVDNLTHIKGAIAAARTGDAVNPQKKSSGSQFYIVQGRPVTDEVLDGIEAQRNFRYSKEQRKQYLELGGTPFLDREYTVFGRVVKGLDVIDKIAAVTKDPRDRPREDLKMTVRVIK